MKIIESLIEIIVLIIKKHELCVNESRENKGINIPDILGRTPLHQAAAKGDLEIIECLIKFGADVNAKTISGETPLMKAIAFYQTDSAHLLLRFGADPEMKNEVTGKNCLNQVYESKNTDLIPLIEKFSEKYSGIILIKKFICSDIDSDISFSLFSSIIFLSYLI